MAIKPPKKIIPTDWDPEDGYTLVLTCVPNSTQWKGLFVGAVSALGYGRYWDAGTGNIKDTLQIAREIIGSIDMTCGDDIKRIADVLEDWYDSTHFDFFEFKSALEAAGLGKFVNWLEALEEVGDLLGVVPDVNVKIPVGDLVEMVGNFFFRRAVKSKMDQMILMQESIGLGQFGPNMAVIIDEIINTIPGGSVADSILGNLDEAVSSVSSDLLTTLTGNYVTNRLDDIRNALNGGLPLAGNVVNSLDGLDETIQGIAAAQITCGCDTGTQIDDEPDATMPPIGPGEVYETEEEYLQDRCSVAHSLIDSILEVIITLDQVNIDTIATVSLGAGLTYTVAAIAATGAGAVVLAVLGLAGAILTAALATGVSLDDMRVNFQAVRGELICALYEATSPDDARDAMATILTNEGLSPAEVFLASLFLPNHALNQIFTPTDSDMIAYGGDCSACGSVFCEIDYEIGTGAFMPGQFYDAGSNDPGAPDPHIVRWETRDLDPDCICLNNVVLEIGETTTRTDFTVTLIDCEGTITNPLVGGQLVQGQIYGPAAQLNITGPQAAGPFTVNVSVYKI